MRVRRVTRVSLSHSQRDLVAQEVGVMHPVSYSSSVSTFCRNEIKDRNYKSVQQHIFVSFFQEKNGWPPYAWCHFRWKFSKAPPPINHSREKEWRPLRIIIAPSPSSQIRRGHLNDTENIPSQRSQKIERALLYPKTKYMSCSLVFLWYNSAPMTPNLKTPKQLTQWSRSAPCESLALKNGKERNISISFIHKDFINEIPREGSHENEETKQC